MKRYSSTNLCGVLFQNLSNMLSKHLKCWPVQWFLIPAVFHYGIDLRRAVPGLVHPVVFAEEVQEGFVA